MAMNIQNPNRAYAAANSSRPMQPTSAQTRVNAGRPGLLSRIGKAVGDLLTTPPSTQKGKSAAGVDSFQKASSNYQVNAERKLSALAVKGSSTSKTPLNVMDDKMVAWMNNELIGNIPPAARPITPTSRPGIASTASASSSASGGRRI